MFKAVYPNASKLKYVTQSIVKISDEAPFVAKEDGLEVRIASPDKTMLCAIRLPLAAFEEYEVEGTETFIVPSTDLNKIVRRGTRNDVVKFELDKENNALILTLRDKKAGFERVFQLDLIPRPIEGVPISEEIEGGVSVIMSADDFKRILGDLRVLGEEAYFMYDNGKLIVRSEEGTKEYMGEFSEASGLMAISSTKSRVKAKYRTDMLLVTAKPLSAAKQVALTFDADKPIRIEYELAGGGSIVFLILPVTE